MAAAPCRRRRRGCRPVSSHAGPSQHSGAVMFHGEACAAPWLQRAAPPSPSDAASGQLDVPRPPRRGSLAAAADCVRRLPRSHLPGTCSDSRAASRIWPTVDLRQPPVRGMTADRQCWVQAWAARACPPSPTWPAAPQAARPGCRAWCCARAGVRVHQARPLGSGQPPTQCEQAVGGTGVCIAGATRPPVQSKATQACSRLHAGVVVNTAHHVSVMWCVEALGGDARQQIVHRVPCVCVRLARAQRLQCQVQRGADGPVWQHGKGLSVLGQDVAAVTEAARAHTSEPSGQVSPTADPSDGSVNACRLAAVQQTGLTCEPRATCSDAAAASELLPCSVPAAHACAAQPG